MMPAPADKKSPSSLPVQESQHAPQNAAWAAFSGNFQNPPASYRLVPFWSWNEVMEPEEIRRQVRLMKKGGWGGAFVHSRVGLLTPYLGEEWFRAVDATIEACLEEGLLVWLYDEDKWPSGYSGGTVPLADERFRAKALLARPVQEPAPADCVPVGEAQSGLQVYVWTAPLGDPWFNGTCAVDRGSRDAMRKFLDDAYESYHQRYAEHYGKLIQAEFTDEPCMMFRVASPVGAIPHSETAFERFREMHGYDPLPHLHLLFQDGSGTERFRLHWHRTINDLFENNFTKQLGEWCTERGIDLTGHFMCEHGVFSQQNWGVKIMPNYRHQHIPGIDHLGRQINERITAKQCQSVVNQFGKKRMLSELYGVAGDGLSFEDRKWIALQQICLGVNLLNPHLSLYTMAGCRKRDFPQNIFYQQPWWELNHLVDDALARLCFAMSQGKYRADILLLHPQESAQALWTTRTAGFDDDLSAPYAGQDWNPCTPAAERAVKAIEKQFFACIDSLLGAQRSFDLGDESIMADAGKAVASEDGGALEVGQMRYRLVIIPSMSTMAEATFQLLRNFHRAGGAILVHGEPPRKIDGEHSPELSAWIDTLPVASPEDFIARAQELAPASLRLEPGSRGDSSLLWVHPRELADGSRLVMVVNLSRKEHFSGTLSIAGAWKRVSQLDEKTGDIHQMPVSGCAADAFALPLNLAPTECGLFLLNREASAPDMLCEGKAGAGSAKSASRTGDLLLVDLPGSLWSVERLDDNALPLDRAAWREGTEWSPGSVPVIEIQNSMNARKYDGPLALRYGFQNQGLAPGRKVHLIVEHPERCRILVNGTEVRTSGLPFWRDIRWMPIDISTNVKAGENSVVLEYPEFRHGDPAIVEPAEARYGTEIESLYLVGDFSVAGKMTGTAPLQHKFQAWQVPPVEVNTILRAGLHITDPRPLVYGDVTAQGLPFYAGRLSLSCALPEMDGGGSASLEIEKLLAAVAKVQVDGQDVGHFLAHPLRVEWTGAGSQQTLNIVLYSTLRNLLGPHHHIEGELIEVGPDHFCSHDIARQSDRHAALRNWAAGTWHPCDWNDDYCLIKFGDLGGLRLSSVPNGPMG